MSESPQSIVRVLALVAFTALFAGLWGTDSASHRKSNGLADRSTPAPAVAPADESDAARTTSTGPKVTDQFGRTETVATTEAPTFETAISVDPGSLTLRPGQLQQHLNQLPLGTPAGRFRIVDDHGGVGWLRVRSTMQADASANSVLQTEWSGRTLHFIRMGQRTIAEHGMNRTVR